MKSDDVGKDLVKVAPRESAEGIPRPLARPLTHDPAIVVAGYVAGLQSPRSRSTAQESLRRIARLVPVPRPLKTPEDLTAMLLTLPEERTWDALQALRMELGDHYPPATANLSMSILRGLLRTAYLQGALTDRQYRLVGELKGIKGARVARGMAVKPEDERRLRAEARALPSYQGTMLDAAIALSIGAGLRREELCGLAMRAVGDGELQVLGKGNKERRPVVDDQMRTVLDAWIVRRETLALEHEGLFVSPERPDRVLSTWTYWDLIRRVAHEAFGSEKKCSATCRCRRILTGPHDFRRTFATRLLEQGYDIREVQQLMGHESVATTQRYDKRSVEKLYERRRKTIILSDGDVT
jgi:site-specific recombinase XerD